MRRIKSDESARSKLTLVLDKVEHGRADFMRKVDAEEVLQQL